MITAEDVIELHTLFIQHKIDIWIDGGWGVDALLGRQTRPHSDLDIALKHSDVPALHKLLEMRGYQDVPRNDTRECNFVLGDHAGRQVDVHSFELDASGNNIFGVPYRAEHLTGTGIIGGYPVKCVPPDWIVKFHTGYRLDADDFQDVKHICDTFGIEMPEEHRAYWKSLQIGKFRDGTEANGIRLATSPSVIPSRSASERRLPAAKIADPR